ncbi:hypothetical protein Tco_0709855 [Tanacetum coccineum]
MATRTKERISALLGTGARKMCHADRCFAAHDAECHGRTESMTADTKKENMSERAKYLGRTGPMTTDIKKENMSGRAEYRERTGPMTADIKKENMTGQKHR